MNSFSARDYLHDYLEQITPLSSVEAEARESAHELGINAPSPATGAFLSSIAALRQAHNAIAITPAACVAGLDILYGMPEQGILSCIDPEPEHQKLAKQTFRAAGYSATRIRFLPSRPLDVMARLASDSYQLIYAEVPTLEAKSLVDAALPLLSANGVLIVADILLDGTPGDQQRQDRETVAVRELENWLQEQDNLHIARLPFGAGMLMVTKTA